jgi:hypothetical protein
VEAEGARRKYAQMPLLWFSWERMDEAGSGLGLDTVEVVTSCLEPSSEDRGSDIVSWTTEAW